MGNFLLYFIKTVNMTWKDIIIFSILVLGFIVVILSIILNDKTPMYILQDIYLVVLLSIIPARRAFHWIKKVSNRKKSVYLVTRLMEPFLERTVRRTDTKMLVEETVSASLSKALKDYNRYFEKD